MQEKAQAQLLLSNQPGSGETSGPATPATSGKREAAEGAAAGEEANNANNMPSEAPPVNTTEVSTSFILFILITINHLAKLLFTGDCSYAVMQVT